MNRFVVDDPNTMGRKDDDDDDGDDNNGLLLVVMVCGGRTENPNDAVT